MAVTETDYQFRSWLVGMTQAVKFVRINATNAGDNIVVAAVTLKKLRILGYAFGAVLAVFVRVKETGGGIKGEFDLAASGRAEYAGSCWARGHLTYMEVP